jgi:hypothetical protein
MNLKACQRETRSAFRGGWLAGIVLIAFAWAGRQIALAEEQRAE